MKPRRQQVRPRRRARLRLRPSRPVALAACAVLGLGAGAALAAHWPARLGALGRVSVTGAARVGAAEVARLAAVAPGTPLGDVDPAAVAARVAAHPWIATARAAALPPDHLLLRVTEYEPAAVAGLGEPARDWLVDAAGTPFVPADAPGPWPRIDGAADAEPDRPDPRLAQALALVREAQEHGLPAPREVDLARPEDPRAAPVLRLPLGDRLVDVLLGGDPPGDAFERLHAWLEAGTPEGASATAIDLRFAGQVILRSDPPPEGDGVADPRGGAGPP